MKSVNIQCFTLIQFAIKSFNANQMQLIK